MSAAAAQHWGASAVSACAHEPQQGGGVEVCGYVGPCQAGLTDEQLLIRHSFRASERAGLSCRRRQWYAQEARALLPQYLTCLACYFNTCVLQLHVQVLHGGFF